MRTKIFVIFVSLSILISSHAYSRQQQQYGNELGWVERNRIEAAVDSFVQRNKHRIGVFRFQPRLSFRGGFDSNAVFGNRDTKHENDFYVLATPGITGGLKFGTRAYLEILQDFNFIYYFKNENRRDIFGNTIAEFVTGTPRVLVTLDGSYTRREQQVNNEVDEPVEHKLTQGEARVDYSATRRLEVSHFAIINDITFVQTQDVIDSDLSLQDRRTFTLGSGIGYALTSVLRLTADGRFNRSEAINTNRFTDSWQLLGGADIRRDRLTGRIQVGFGENSPDQGQSRNNFLLDGRVDLLFGRRMHLGLNASRRYEFSYLSDVATRVVTEGEVRFNTLLEKRLALIANYLVGSNDYGDTPISGVIVNHDTFQHGELSVNVRVIRGLSLRPGIQYIKRDTDIPGLNKSDFFYFVGVNFGYSVSL